MAHEGWDSEIFVEPPAEQDLCGICCEVLEDAVETPCGHAFCEKCMKNWLTQRQVCPQDQSAISWDNCHPMVRDRRRILGLKVKCGWCEEQMELREYRAHRHRKCKSRPDDYEPTPTPPPGDLDGSGKLSIRGSIHEEKKEEKKEEFALELFPDGDGDQKAKEAKEREEKDRRFALEMEERNRREAQQRRTPRAAGQPSPQPQGEAHVDELIEAQVVFEPIVDEDNGAAGEDEAEGQPDPRLKRKRRQNGCCGCSDKIWCCLCCFIWILIGLAVLVYLKYGSGSFSSVGV